MRKKTMKGSQGFKIMVLDDDEGIIDTLTVILNQSGYDCVGYMDPLEAIEEVKQNHYDLLILDYLMSPIHGDEVVERIREFNDELYILLLTGHKDLAPPLETIKKLDIQGYCEKSDRFDQILLLVESGIKSVSQMNTIKKFRDGLNKIIQSIPRIYQLQPITNILEDILREILPLVNSKNAFILVDNLTDEDNKSIFMGIGKYQTDIDQFITMLSADIMDSIGHARESCKEVRLQKAIILPLMSERFQSIGVIFAECETSEEGLKLLQIYASQASSSLNNAFLHSLVNVKNEELKKTYDNLKTRYLDTIEALRLVVDAKDTYTKGHSDRVSKYCVKIGKELNLPAEDIEKLEISGFFHDIGKIGTTDDILLKKEKLSRDEYEEIKKHPIKGANILSAVSMFQDIVPFVRYHHERLDGSGYPSGLKGNNIPFLSRVIAVADAFDAMMSDRMYRSRLNIEDAKEQLLQGAGTQFDTGIVHALIGIIDSGDVFA
ncbi:MAG: DUF3369 domain-containing protein [Clostridia bacterium]